jgi:hypothetical protein
MCHSHLIYIVQPCLIHTCHVALMPCSDHAVLLKATAQHSRRETAYGLPARVQLLPATTRSCTKIVIRNIPILPQPSIPTTVKSGSSTLQNVRSVNCLAISSDVCGYHADFHEGHDTFGTGQGRGMACVAWERHERGMLCVNPS